VIQFMQNGVSSMGKPTLTRHSLAISTSRDFVIDVDGFA
jgi:hypothetical protein